MTDYERLIYNECLEPKTSVQIRRKLNMKESTLKNRLARMSEKGMIKIINLEGKPHHHGRLYQSELSYKQQIEYKPLGICVMGVWM